MQKTMDVRVAFANALVELANGNDKVVVLDADLANATGVDLFHRAYPDRFYQCGIAEQNMIGMAAGMATVGWIPFACSFACFASTRVLDQVRVVGAQTRSNIKICGAYSGILVGGGGKTHHAIEDIAVYRSMPNMVVLAPCDGVETRQAIFAMAEYNGPMYIRMSREALPVIFGEDYRFAIGVGVVLLRGSDVALIATGAETIRALQAADILAADGVSVYLLHLPTIKPLDEAAVIKAAQASGCVVTCEEHSIIGGLGRAVAEVLGEQYPTPIRRVGIRDVFAESGANKPLLEKYGLTAEHVAAAARKMVESKRSM